MAFLFTLVTAVIVIAQVASYRNRERRLEWHQRWLRLASKYGEPSAPALSPEMSFTTQAGEACVRASLAGVRLGQELGFRLGASHTLPGVPAFVLWPDPALLLKDVSDVATGLSFDFDKQFVVRSSAPPELLRAVLGRVVEPLMRYGFTLGSDGVMVTLGGRDAFMAEEMFDAALEIVRAVATVDLCGFGALRALPGAIYEPPSGPWERRHPPSVVLPLGQPVTLHFAGGAAGPVTVAYASCDERAPEIEVELGQMAEGEEAAPPMELPADAWALAHDIGVARLSRRHRAVRLVWEGIVHEERRLLAGAQLVAALGREVPDGPYR
ncbi:MAG TPA: hypothetical protein VH877_26420 [Polyangia bacterium]|nr:hypothetical protein [Polyangia bacterium]